MLQKFPMGLKGVLKGFWRASQGYGNERVKGFAIVKVFKGLLLKVGFDGNLRRVLYTSICLSNFFVRLMFAFILLFVDFVRYLTFWHHKIQI